ncbi:MAG: hypothetical protein IT372_34325 [Polyangiaceae bacterium]|nr:hypothetical protein [Polyangiaceae bacterium]
MTALWVDISRSDVVAAHPVLFIVDTGSSFSFVQRFEVRKLLEGLPEQKEQWTGAEDANGRKMMGIPLDVGMRLVDARRFPEVVERIWVTRTGNFNLLGQTFLEKVSGHFMNFPESPYGRQFSLSLSPYRT